MVEFVLLWRMNVLCELKYRRLKRLIDEIAMKCWRKIRRVVIAREQQ